MAGQHQQQMPQQAQFVNAAPAPPSVQQPPMSTPASSYNNNQVFKLGGDEGVAGGTSPATSSSLAPPQREMASLGIGGPAIAGGGKSYKEQVEEIHGNGVAPVDSRVLTEEQRRAGYFEVV